MGSDISEAIILAGGLGTRLKAMVADMPKPMIGVNGRPFLEYQIDYLKNQDIKKVILCVSYLKEQIIDYFGDGRKFGINIEYAVEKEPLGTGGAIKNAAIRMDLADHFLVLNGDTFVSWERKNLEKRFFDSGAKMVIMVTSMLESNSSLITVDANNRVIDYIEKSGMKRDQPVFCGAGVYVMKKDLVREWPDNKLSLEYGCIPRVVKEGSAYAEIIDSKMYDIGTPERIRIFREYLNKKTRPPDCRLCACDRVVYYLTDFQDNRYWKCSKCGFVFQDPVPGVPGDSSAWTNAIDPDGKRRDLTKERDFKLKNWYGSILDNIKPLRAGKVLDLGCGLGYLLSAFPSGWEKYGFDISGFAHNFIKSNFPDINLAENLRLDEAVPPAEHLNAYDVVVCYHVIEHVAHPEVFLKNLAMLLKPRGTLIIGTPNIGSIAAKLFRGNFRLLGSGHVSLFNTKNIVNLMEKNGLRVYKKEFPFFKTDYFNFNNLLRMLNPLKVSPPFYGNIMTFYAQNKK